MDYYELEDLIRSLDGDAKAIKKLAREILAARTEHGDTLLHIFAAEGHAKTVAALLDAGSDVNARDNFGSTPIQCAAFGEHSAVITLLMKAGADVNIQDSTGSSTLENLRLVGKDDVAQLLEAMMQGRKR
jgi:ankyrin repeat protein